MIVFFFYFFSAGGIFQCFVDYRFITGIFLGDIDRLSSPSSRIIVGRHIKGGTGAFDLLIPGKYCLKSSTKNDISAF